MAGNFGSGEGLYRVEVEQVAEVGKDQAQNMMEYTGEGWRAATKKPLEVVPSLWVGKLGKDYCQTFNVVEVVSFRGGVVELIVVVEKSVG